MLFVGVGEEAPESHERNQSAKTCSEYFSWWIWWSSHQGVKGNDSLFFSHFYFMYRSTDMVFPIFPDLFFWSKDLISLFYKNANSQFSIYYISMFFTYKLHL